MFLSNILIMGGKLFNLGRIPKKQYLEIEKKMCFYLDNHFSDYYKIPRFYANKADFGDVDILVSSELMEKMTWAEFKKTIITDLAIDHHESSKGIFSVIYENFQVDFILQNKNYFESTYSFLCFNDIGNIIGKIFKKFNLKYGENGLLYVFRRQDNHYAKDLLISTNFEKIYAFLGLDYQKWLIGFESKEEMFNWVISSPYFSVQPYIEMSNRMEKRQKERPTIAYFLDYLEEKKITKNYTFQERDTYLPLINDFFPKANLISGIKEEQEREQFVLLLKEKYNGKLIMKMFPILEGKVLGKFMNDFQEQFENYEKYLSEMTKQEIEKELRLFFTKFDLN